jgi:hypothetical protein
MAVDRRRWVLAWGALAISALALGGCSTTIADLPAVGTPADAPERPKEAGAYLPVHDLPPDREEAVISPAERAKIQAELSAARERQAAGVATGTKDGKAKPDSKSEAKADAKSKAKPKNEPKAEAKADQ